MENNLESAPKIFIDESVDENISHRIRFIDESLHRNPNAFIKEFIMLGNLATSDTVELRTDKNHENILPATSLELIKEFMRGRFDRYVTYDQETENAIANDKFHKKFLQLKAANKNGQDAIKARDEVRKSRFLIYITQIMEYEKSNIQTVERKVV